MNGRKEICLKCSKIEQHRGVYSCPLFGRELMSAINKEENSCEYWPVNKIKRATNVKFYRNTKEIINLTNLWKDQKVFLLCNGPSRNDYDLDLLNQPGIMTMTINNGGHDFRSDFWVSQDTPAKFMSDIWLDPKIMKFTNMASFNHTFFSQKDGSKIKVGSCQNIYYHQRNGNQSVANWLSLKNDFISWNTPKELGPRKRSTMLAAIHILYVLGFTKIYLLGADLKMSKESKYCFKQDRTARSIKHNTATFKALVTFLKVMRPKFEEGNLFIYNCGKTALNVFDYVPYEDAIEDCKIYTGGSTDGMYEGKRG